MSANIQHAPFASWWESTNKKWEYLLCNDVVYMPTGNGGGSSIFMLCEEISANGTVTSRRYRCIKGENNDILFRQVQGTVVLTSKITAADVPDVVVLRVYTLSGRQLYDRYLTVHEDFTVSDLRTLTLPFVLSENIATLQQHIQYVDSDGNLLSHGNQKIWRKSRSLPGTPVRRRFHQRASYTQLKLDAFLKK